MHVREGRICCDDAAFVELAGFLLEQGTAVKFRATGNSMQPFIRDGDVVLAVPLGAHSISRGDVLLYTTQAGKIVVHRVIRKGRNGCLLPKGDAAPWSNESWIDPASVWGRVVRVERHGRQIDATGFANRWLGWGYSLLRTVPQRLYVIMLRLRSRLAGRFSDPKVDCCPEGGGDS